MIQAPKENGVAQATHSFYQQIKTQKLQELGSYFTK